VIKGPKDLEFLAFNFWQNEQGVNVNFFKLILFSYF